MTKQGKVEINKDHSDYNFLVSKNGVTILEQNRPIGIISIKEWLEKNTVVQNYSLIKEMYNEQHRVLHYDSHNHIYIVEFPQRKQSINIELDNKKILHKTYNLPIHYWCYRDGKYYLLFNDGKLRYPFNLKDTLSTRRFFNLHNDGTVCFGQIKVRQPNNPKDVISAYNQFWGSLFNDEMWEFFSSNDYKPLEKIYTYSTLEYYKEFINE